VSEAEESDFKFVKLAAVEVVRQLSESRQLLLEQHSHSFKWLTASLLAINGGAALAVLSNESIESEAKVIAGAFFSIGIFLALLIGVLSQRANQLALVPLNNAMGYWLAVAQDGERFEELEEEHQRQFKPVQRLSLASQILGWLSACLFCAGIVTTGLGLTEHKDVVHVESARLDRGEFKHSKLNDF